MAYQTVVIERTQDGVTTLTLNRPDKRNCMNPQLHVEMTEALEELRYDDATRVLVITGAGESFSAGMDLKEFFTELKDEPAEFDRIARLSTEWRGRTLRYFPKPTIAKVNGYCFGGAFSIVEGCDLAYCADEAIFGLSEINMKFFPGGPVSMSLAKLLRPREAMYYAMTGESFDGRTAADIGLVNRTYPAAELDAAVRDVAGKLVDKDPHALLATKDAYRHSLEMMTWDAGVDYAAAKQAQLSLKQGDTWRSRGMGDFLTGSYRPGLETHR
jgi:feruloyl-CoA hydratase/lyase